MFKQEMLLRTPLTTLFLIFCEVILNFQVIFKIIIDPDDNYSMTF